MRGCLAQYWPSGSGGALVQRSIAQPATTPGWTGAVNAPPLDRSTTHSWLDPRDLGSGVHWTVQIAGQVEWGRRRQGMTFPECSLQSSVSAVLSVSLGLSLKIFGREAEELIALFLSRGRAPLLSKFVVEMHAYFISFWGHIWKCSELTLYLEIISGASQRTI